MSNHLLMLSPVKSTNSAANLWQWHLKLNLDKLKIWGCVLCSVKALRLNIVVGCVNHSHSLCLSCPASTWLSRQSFGQMHIWKETADHCQGCIGLNNRPAVGVRISSMGCPPTTILKETNANGKGYHCTSPDALIRQNTTCSPSNQNYHDCQHKTDQWHI